MEARPRAVTSEENGATDPSIRIVILALLAVDGVLSALAGALLMPLYIGSIPFPVSALLSGLVNAALVWAAGRWTHSPRVAALPLWTWLITVGAMGLGFPNDDVILGGQGILRYGALILIVLGVAPPAWVLWRRAARG
ncbi:hypothetical protein [Mycobacterium lacus]|uniref:hypothetical protein n=1 Tax=Mycobacterium lacus TaxID=169765 RepID=UPI000A2253DF|nr:hypothetical protein AWC15_12675 [Mycobacterium lacus]